jgi:bacterioferritin-associated ferredoxin
MIICSCNVISDHEVRIALASKPLRTIGGLFRYLGCTAQCGRCARSIKRIMDEPRRIETPISPAASHKKGQVQSMLPGAFSRWRRRHPLRLASFNRPTAAK